MELVRAQSGTRAAGFVNAVLRRVGRARRAGLGAAARPRRRRGPGRPRRLRPLPPAVDRAGLRRRAGAAAGRDGPARSSTPRWPPTTPARGAPPGPAGGDHGRRAGARDRRQRGPVLALRRAPRTRKRRDRRDGGRGRGARGGAGRGQPAGGPRAVACRARWAPTPAAGSTCARPGRQGRAAGRAGRRCDGATLDAVERARTAPSWCAARSTDCRSRCTPPTAGRRRCPTPPTTACSWTRRAPGSVRCGAARRPGGGADPGDVSGLTKLQRELLTAALRHVRPGGVVAYVTCSPHLAETAGVLARGAAPPSRAWSGSTPGSTCPACPISATAPPCSCGRTATAPTRCSWRCLRRVH